MISYRSGNENSYSIPFNWSQNKVNAQTQIRGQTKDRFISKFIQMEQNQKIDITHPNSQFVTLDNATLSNRIKKRKKRQSRRCLRRKCNMVRNFN